MTHLSFRRSSTPLAPKRGSGTLALNKSSDSRPTHAITLTVVGSASVPPIGGPNLVFGAPLSRLPQRVPLPLTPSPLRVEVSTLLVFFGLYGLFSLSYQRVSGGEGVAINHPLLSSPLFQTYIVCTSRIGAPLQQSGKGKCPLGNPGIDTCVDNGFHVGKRFTGNEHVGGKNWLFDEGVDHLVPLLSLFLDQSFF